MEVSPPSYEMLPSDRINQTVLVELGELPQAYDCCLWEVGNLTHNYCSPRSKLHNNLRLSLKGLLLAGYFNNVLVLKWNGKENAKRVKLRWWVWKTQTEKTKLWYSQSLPVTKLFYDLKTNFVEELRCNIHCDCKWFKSSVLVATFYHCCASFSSKLV